MRKLGLTDRPGFRLYLDREFRFDVTPLLLVPIRGTGLTRAVASPDAELVGRYAWGSGA